ncbi:aminopeptidase [Patescibacteria group bacterium]
MLTKIQLDKYADLMIAALYSCRNEKYQRGDIIQVSFDPAAIRLAEIIQGKLLDLGMNPIVKQLPSPTMEHNFYSKANRNQIVFVDPGKKELCRHLNGHIVLWAVESLTHLKDVDPRKIGKARVAHKFLKDIVDKREEQGEFGWTLCSLPTEECAKKAGLTLRQYTNQIIKACYLNEENPVQVWKKTERQIKKTINWLNNLPIIALHIESANIDLEIALGRKRQWRGGGGANIPSLEIFVSPDWRGTRGVYYSDLPTYRSGNYLEKIRLEFINGRVAQATAKKGEKFLRTQLAMDKGAAQIGEFSLTDKRFSKIDKFMAEMLYDENFGGKHGNCHLAVGSSYSDTFAGNQASLTKEKKKSLGFNDSALHWDLVNTERKRVTAILKGGGKMIIYENGIFLN